MRRDNIFNGTVENIRAPTTFSRVVLASGERADFSPRLYEFVESLPRNLSLGQLKNSSKLGSESEIDRFLSLSRFWKIASANRSIWKRSRFLRRFLEQRKDEEVSTVAREILRWRSDKKRGSIARQR